MKNQYFGDYRDMFKYDLVREVMKGSGDFMHFSFIPMLTEFKENSDGNKRDYNPEKIKKRPGSGNTDLVNYLRKYTKKPEDRNIMDILEYFRMEGIDAEIYNPSGIFAHKKRDEYFSNIPDRFFNSALVFVDPDNGLEVSKSSKKHILYREVRDLYNRMSDNSILMIYQHYPRVPHEEYTRMRKKKLREKTGSSQEPLWISDNEIIFFFLSKDPEVHENINSVLSAYHGRYAEKCSAGCRS